MSKSPGIEPALKAPPHIDETESSISLHTAQGPLGASSSERYVDAPSQAPLETDEDLPPLYTDHDFGQEGGASCFNPLAPTPLVAPFKSSSDGRVEYFLDKRLDSDAVFLVEHVRQLATVPPRLFARIQGTHHARRRRDRHDDEGSSQSSVREQVVDFDIRIELTHLLYSDIARRQAWRTIVTAGNFDKVHRGTVFAERAPGFGGRSSSSVHVENGVSSLEAWCQGFCARKGGLRCFVLERRIQGWDYELLTARLTGLARATNYRGRVSVTFPIKGERIEVWNACRTNQWRLTRWIRALVYVTMLWIMVWPWLALRTRKWETVAAEWNMSRPARGTGSSRGRGGASGRREYAAGMSEEAWYAAWAAGIQRAMLERRDGELDQADLEGRRDEVAGVQAMGLVNRSFGWGEDEF
ncbi:hypothetical protein CDD81_1771 [Ophiocordyceps australis]|uniref:Uncharacterized protein n=1 Tax=Ophiocordyceps australis TaxID=1399860 RepID=A0A2C5Y872_9HYPO|nr:hypothetical protein CDD81_1771 [Ophiocordyceps australis]